MESAGLPIQVGPVVPPDGVSVVQVSPAIVVDVAPGILGSGEVKPDVTKGEQCPDFEALQV